MASHQDCRVAGGGGGRPLVGRWEDSAGPHGGRGDAQLSEGPEGEETHPFGHAHAQRGGWVSARTVLVVTSDAATVGTESGAPQKCGENLESLWADGSDSVVRKKLRSRSGHRPVGPQLASAWHPWRSHSRDSDPSRGCGALRGSAPGLHLPRPSAVLWVEALTKRQSSGGELGARAHEFVFFFLKTAPRLADGAAHPGCRGPAGAAGGVRAGVCNPGTVASILARGCSRPPASHARSPCLALYRVLSPGCHCGPLPGKGGELGTHRRPSLHLLSSWPGS